MITRYVRCVVTEEDAPAFLDHARQVIARHQGHVDGLLWLQLGVRHLPSGEVAVLGQSQWRDFDAMRAFYGEHLYTAYLWDPDEQWLRNAAVEHFEVVGASGDPASD